MSVCPARPTRPSRSNPRSCGPRRRPPRRRPRRRRGCTPTRVRATWGGPGRRRDRRAPRAVRERDRVRPDPGPRGRRRRRGSARAAKTPAKGADRFGNLARTVLDAVSGRHESGPSASTVARDATRCAAIGTYLVEASARARARGVGVGAPAGITNRGRRLRANVRVPHRAAPRRCVSSPVRLERTTYRLDTPSASSRSELYEDPRSEREPPDRLASPPASLPGVRGVTPPPPGLTPPPPGVTIALRGSHRARAFRVRVPGSIRPGGFSPRRLTGDGRPGRLTLGAIRVDSAAV